MQSVDALQQCRAFFLAQLHQQRGGQLQGIFDRRFDVMAERQPVHKGAAAVFGVHALAV